MAIRQPAFSPHFFLYTSNNLLSNESSGRAGSFLGAQAASKAMTNSTRQRNGVGWAIALLLLLSIVLPVLVHPMRVVTWRLDLIVGALFSLLSSAWYILDCRCLHSRSRTWLVVASALLPFVAIPVHRFITTGARQGAIFAFQLLSFIAVALAIAFGVYAGLNHFCELPTFGGFAIDGGGYYQFWGCF